MNNFTWGINNNTEFRPGSKYTFHAEMSALDKLQKTNKYRNSKKGKKYILISIRVTRSGKLKNSKPCKLCIQHMQRLQKRKNFKIIKVLWSNSEGDFSSANLEDLANNIPIHYSRQHRKVLGLIP